VKRRYAVAAAAGVLALLALVPIGIWERGDRADEEVSGMRTVLAAVGPLDNPSLTAFRYFNTFQCLVYRRAGIRLALELCFDGDGRLIEAIDRRSGDPRIWSLRDDPTRSTIHVDRVEVDRLLERMGVPRGYLPTGFEGDR
jgi:hypothetical protein